MKFVEGSVYHIYNRGNNKQPIFFKDDNYAYFRQKIIKYISTNSDILAWCLMPNHFHFLIHANESTCKLVKHTPIPINALTEGIRLLLSSYTKGIQKQERITGNLFQQKTKSKCVDDYAFTAFHYIHQNAYKANLVKKLEDYQFCSVPEYLFPERDSLCNKTKATQLLGIRSDSFLKDSYDLIDEAKIKEIW